MESLANKYRPQTFDDVVGQDVTVKILNKQIDNNSFSHSMLFVGNAGCGKTTCAKIFAKRVNAEIFNLDCASHNGIADIKNIIAIAKKPPLVYDYKVIILDECHTLSSAAWPALLITLEENIPHCIFILCTTDVQKVPNTVISRSLRFNFMPIPESIIVDRLKYICNNENLDYKDEEALEIIAKSAKGGMRQAIANLEKCSLYNTKLNSHDAKIVLNIVSNNIMNELYQAVDTHNDKKIIHLILALYSEGFELHLLIDQFIDFCLYDYESTDINIIKRLLKIKQEIKYDNDPKNLIIAYLITY